MTTTQESSPAKEQTGTAYHWVMTVQADDGRQGTNDGLVNVIPGLHTHQSTYTEVLRAVKEWIDSDNVTVLHYAIALNQL